MKLKLLNKIKTKWGLIHNYIQLAAKEEFVFLAR